MPLDFTRPREILKFFKNKLMHYYFEIYDFTFLSNYDHIPNQVLIELFNQKRFSKVLNKQKGVNKPKFGA